MDWKDLGDAVNGVADGLADALGLTHTSKGCTPAFDRVLTATVRDGVDAGWVGPDVARVVVHLREGDVALTVGHAGRQVVVLSGLIRTHGGLWVTLGNRMLARSNGAFHWEMKQTGAGRYEYHVKAVVALSGLTGDALFRLVVGVAGEWSEVADSI